ncbi:MAG: hypothetical protein ACI8P3_001632 [Saprospiraceae bacterium]|jgi:hypothetical protein
MKKTLPIFTFLLFCAMSSFAQNDVTLNIFHKLGTADFAALQESENNINNSFNIKRLEYYISEITILHDSGLETEMQGMHILVDANEATNIALGNYDITEVASIRFHIGVEEASNHLDPASYQSTNPLSPQNPSMHWGWTSGYRFVAMEGFAGSSLNALYELHGLGDQNYFMTQVDVAASAINGAINIDLYADYNRALENIEVNPGVIVHGFGGAALTVLENFRDYVFSPAVVTSTPDLSEINAFEVYPNPAPDGISNIKLSVKTTGNYQLEIRNVLGQTISNQVITALESIVPVRLKNDGIYFISLIQNGKFILTEKLIIAK